MARGCSKGFGSRGSTIQSSFSIRAAGHFSCPPVQSHVPAYKSFLLLLGLCLLAGWLAVPLLAQNDDVHIAPRETKKAEECRHPKWQGRMSIPLSALTPSR